MRIFNFKFIFACVFIFKMSTAVAYDPRLDYRKMTSAHFEIIYDAKSYALAKVYLTEAERAYSSLTKVFSESPEKTILVLDNTTDLANGSATPIPRPTVTAYVNPPAPLSTIDEYSFWPRDLVTHEYTHILNMEPTHGWIRPFRTIFGSIIRPNAILPGWYLEGLAVEMESNLNENGRLKSTDYDAMIRAFYNDKKWGNENLSQINEATTPTWPQGQRRYFYGALLMHELGKEKGLHIYEELNQRYSRRIPFLINAPMEDNFDKTFQEMLKDVYKKYEDIAAKQIEILKTQKVTEGQKIKIDNLVNARSIELSPDGSKLAVVSDLDGGQQVWMVLTRSKDTFSSAKRKGAKIDADTKDLDKVSTERMSWFPDSKRIVFDASGTFHHYYLYYDLMIWNTETGKIDQLTMGYRAREPSVSPSGNKIVYVTTDRGETNLGLIDSNGKNPHTIYVPPQFLRVSHPSFINENEIVFAQKNSRGDDQLQVYNLETKKIERVYTTLKNSRVPTVTKSGIVFTSTDSGAENLYLTSFDFKKTQALTNTISRIQVGTLDPSNNTVLYSEMTSDGSLLKIAKAENISKLPHIDQPLVKDFPKDPVKNYPTAIVDAPEKNYHGINYMFPQFIMPELYGVPNGIIAGLDTIGTEPLGFHNYMLRGYYDSRPARWGGDFLYDWHHTFGETVFFAGEDLQYYNQLDISTSTRSASVDHMIYLLPNNERLGFAAGYMYRGDNVPENSGIFDRRHYYSHGPRATLSYSYLQQSLTDLQPVGEFIKVTYTRVNNKTLKKDYDQVYGNVGYYHRKWLPRGHTLSFNFKGIHTPANRNLLLASTTSQNEFSFGPAQDGFVIRGYPDGEFLGYTMIGGTMEYSLPFSNIYSGPDNPFPFFAKRFYGDLFVDTVSLRGDYFDDKKIRRTKIGKYFASAGFEFKWDLTLFYGYPITFKIVLANGFSNEANGGFAPYFTFVAPQIF